MGPKWPISPNKIFFRNPANEPCFFYSWLSTWQKSDINLFVMIKEYWNLIGWEPFLPLTWELDFSQAGSFHMMLMNHKNFDFTQMPDKTNGVIFKKSSKTMLLGYFRPFLPMGIFPKRSSSVTHNYIWNPNIMLSFRKN